MSLWKKKPKPMKTNSDDKTGLPVVECFASLQGEGFHSGQAAWFVRLAGCRNACAFCDTPQSWDMDAFARRSEEDLVREAVESGCVNCVVTGGEPMLHNLDGLCRRLHEAGLQCWLETSGSEPLSGEWDWICLSPKKGVEVREEYYRKASEIKIVIGSDEDFSFAEEQAGRVGRDCLRYLQPEWSVSKGITQKITRYILEKPIWRLSLQMHKFAGIA